MLDILIFIYAYEIFIVNKIYKFGIIGHLKIIDCNMALKCYILEKFFINKM